MGSAEPDDTGRLHAAFRWLPIAILVVVLVGATGALLRSEAPPRGDAVANDDANDAPDIPVLSVRRSLDPLLGRAADAGLVADLDAFVETLPPETCLAVRAGSVDYEYRADDPQIPASIQKLVVAVAALIELGGDATYVTDVHGALGGDGVVQGDLFLQGGGDPILSTAPYAARSRNQPQIFSDFDRLADAVVAAGVTAVTGAVVGDEHRYDNVRYNPIWPGRHIVDNLTGPLSALSVNDGLAYFPDAGGVFGASAEPAQYAAQVLTDALRARGVRIDADPAVGATPPDLARIAAHESPPMAQIVAQMLQDSDNTTAELLLKEVGLASAGAGTFDAGQVSIESILADAGLAVDDATIVDGSGLATQDQVTCTFVVDLLEYSPTADTIRAGLAVAGESGTLSRRWADTDLQGRIHAKTGTLDHVTALAGRAETRDGSDARFSLIINLPEDEFVTAELVAEQQVLAEILTAHPDVPEVDHLRPVP
ncbi:MAG: D-alanyl-D-alanine carboxypeptidase/D-alanyl-D-alanine-endopeptidase [Acidimicrobiales bacterium]|nr:D-alanyl-D-alanine carboxypeptidase/D-alanyl-D-alanine-endopeptidase [Acidimicrobiales bacterium]